MCNAFVNVGNIEVATLVLISCFDKFDLSSSTFPQNTSVGRTLELLAKMSKVCFHAVMHDLLDVGSRIRTGVATATTWSTNHYTNPTEPSIVSYDVGKRVPTTIYYRKVEPCAARWRLRIVYQGSCTLKDTATFSWEGKHTLKHVLIEISVSCTYLC